MMWGLLGSRNRWRRFDRLREVGSGADTTDEVDATRYSIPSSAAKSTVVA